MTGNASVFWALATLGCGASAVALRIAFARDKQVAPFINVGALIGGLVFGSLWLADNTHAAQPLTVNALRCRIMAVTTAALVVGCLLPQPPPLPSDADDSGLEKD
jgi:hypothetical protein